MLKKLLVTLSLTTTLAHAEFISSKITPELKTKIKNQTGLVINNNVQAVIIYTKNGVNHYVLLDNYADLITKTKKLKLLKSNSGIQYPIKKYYIHVTKKLGKGFVDLEYEIMLARSYDGDLGAKDKKYLNVLLDSGAGVDTGGINDPQEEHVYTSPELDTPHFIGSIGDVIKNVTLNATLNDPDNAVVIDSYLPENINPKTKIEVNNEFAIDFKNASKFSIPIPLPSWKWSHDFSYDSSTYQITSKSNNNILSHDFIWDLNGEPTKWSVNNSQSWRCQFMFTPPNYNCDGWQYYDKQKLQWEGYLYSFRPKYLIRYSAKPDYNGKSELYLNTFATFGRLLSSVTDEHWYETFDTVRAVDDKTSFTFDKYSSYKIDTTFSTNDSQHLTIDWSSPVFEQYYPTTYKFISDNLCLTSKGNKVVASTCLINTDVNYHTQKWLFDSDDKLIRSFDNVNNCVTYQKNEFVLSKCDANLSENSWFNKLPNDQNYKLYYKNKFITVQNGKLGLATTAKDVLVKLDNY